MNLKKLAEAGIIVSGDTSYREKCPLETAEQVSFLAMLRAEFPELAKIATHIRNEGLRSRREGARQKVEGLNTGAPDIVIPCSPPILIELKQRNHTKSSVSDSQIIYLKAAQKLGAFCRIALGAVGAMEAVREWHTLNQSK